MAAETGIAEIAKNIPLLKQPRDWIVEPSDITLMRPDGSSVGLVISPYLRENNVLHSNLDQGNITYDIPTDGDFNLIIYSNKDSDLIPLAAASVGIENEIPTITMIQRVKPRVKRELPSSNPDSPIKINAIYDRVIHPKQDLLQGENKINWQEALLNQCEATVKAQGYDRLRLRSGFVSKYAEVGHNLSLAVQQYDYLINSDKNWIPIDQQGQQITNPEQRLDLSRVIKRIRDKKIIKKDEVGLQYPNLPIPTYWERNL